MISRRFKAAFEPGFPEMTDEDWKALEQSHREKARRWEKEKSDFRKQMRQEWDEEDREWRERERRLHQRTRREMNLASEIVKVANMIIAGIALNGMNRRQASRKVNEILSRHTKGFFTDDSWVPVDNIWKALTAEGIDWTMEGSRYDHDPHTGVPTSKTWKFKVDFQNERGRPTTMYGVVTASGAGTVQDPLSRYDLVAYIS